jgi:hypothetical protein
MKKYSRTIAIVVLVAWFLGAFIGAKAQNVVRKGNVFEQVEKKDSAIKTSFVYKDKNGVSYPIYLSSKGKAYIICKSKKTGKTYKRYLPKVTEQLKKELK